MNISFNQTFKQKSSKQKTLHNTGALIQASEINEANPAKFELDLLMIDESSTYQHIPLYLLLYNDGDDVLKTFDLYIDPSKSTDAPRKMYKIQTCVFESGAFEIARDKVINLKLQGAGTKLERIAHSTFSVGSYASAPTYSIPKVVTVTVDGTVLDRVTGVALEVQNDIKWNKNNTVQASLEATSATNSTYPTSFVLEGRSVAGNITTYVDAQASNLQNWKENIAIRIQAGLASNNTQLDAQLTPCSFTNRVNPTEVFTQGYDYRMIGNPTNLETLFTY
jgi:hypothetical protein